MWEELCSRWGALGGSGEEDEKGRTSNPLGMRAKASYWHRRPRSLQPGTNSFREGSQGQMVGVSGWEVWGGEGSSEETRASSPRELPACVIAMVGGGPLRDGAGEGRQ